MVRDTEPSDRDGDRRAGRDGRRPDERRPDEPRTTSDNPATIHEETRSGGRGVDDRRRGDREMRPEDPRSVYGELPGRDRYDAYGEVPGEENPDRPRDWGLVAVLFLVGVGLLLFPEPATSVIGVSLIALALVAAAIEWFR